METSSETESEPWIMLEDSDIEVCDEPSKTKEVTSEEEQLKVRDQTEEEDDFAKLQRHRKFIKQLEATPDLSWDASDITSDTAKLTEEPATSETVCTRCSVCSALFTKGGSKLASYMCNTFLALCILAIASGLAYYLQFPDQFKSGNIKNAIARYTQPDHARKYDKYLEKNKKYYNDLHKYPDHPKYEDTTRKMNKKKLKNNDNYDYKEYNNKRKDLKKNRHNKNDFDEKRYNKKYFDTKANKEFKQQRKNSKSKGDY